MPIAIGVDVGGTFTDVVVSDGEALSGRKLPTTPDQSLAVAVALSEAGTQADSLFLHGTTAGTNALLEGRWARTALVTSPGFEDLVEIGRQARPSLYDPFADRAAPLVERGLRLGFDGDTDALVATLRSARVDVLAVAMIRSYLDPSDELAIAATLEAELGIPVSTGARISPAFREYERVATTVLNASLTPEVAGYLERLDRLGKSGRRLVMTSSGGLLPFDVAVGYAGRLVLSGPAAGVVAATELGLAKGHESVISFDMGGTSTDVCRITGTRSAGESKGRTRAGWVNRVPALPIRTIGAGGGSLAWVDSGGALRVGPRSAGSVPGPAAYGGGGEQATVTDANVVLGRIPASLALGGSVTLDVLAAERAVRDLGKQIGLSVDRTAAGIIEVVETQMERAIRAVSVEEGVDPRESVLVAFGGAGGLHASRLARRLGMRRILVPPLSGVFSALGLLLARPSSDAIRTVMLTEGDRALSGTLASIVAEAQAAFALHHGGASGAVSRHADVRYVGQSHELVVPASPDWIDLRSGFEAEHRARFGFIRQGQQIELVNVRAEVTGTAPMSWSDLPSLGMGPAPTPTVGPDSIPVWQRGRLPGGFEVEGPAIVVESDSALWLELGEVMTVHDDGTLEIGQER